MVEQGFDYFLFTYLLIGDPDLEFCGRAIRCLLSGSPISAFKGWYLTPLEELDGKTPFQVILSKDISSLENYLDGYSPEQPILLPVITSNVIRLKVQYQMPVCAN